MRPDLRVMAEYCRMSKLELVRRCDWHTHNANKGYLAMKRTPGAKILAVAHIDFLASGVVHSVSKRRIVSSALDDRAGVYIVMDLLPKMGILADVLLTDNEEMGQSTIKDLGISMLEPYNWLVQFDRRNEGAVHYGYKEMAPLLEKHFPSVEFGAFSCIAAIEACSPVCAFNVGVGYSQEHSERCELSGKVLHRQMSRFLAFYTEMVDTKLPHVGTNVGEEVHAKKYVYVPIPKQQQQPSWGGDGYDDGEFDEYWAKKPALSAVKPEEEKQNLFTDDYCVSCDNVVHNWERGYCLAWDDASLCARCLDRLLAKLEQTEKYTHVHVSDIAYFDAKCIWFWDNRENVYVGFDVVRDEWFEEEHVLESCDDDDDNEKITRLWP